MRSSKSDRDGFLIKNRRSEAGQVPAPAVWRLSLYLRELDGLLERDCQTVSSKQLGANLGLTGAQVRKDLAHFGQFGHPGIGYPVAELCERLRAILGTNRPWNALLVGAGNLGRALLSYRVFLEKGFQVVAVFDNDPSKVGQDAGTEPRLAIQAMEELEATIVERKIEMAILSVPAAEAQVVADRLAKAGVKGILNFAPTSLAVRDGVAVASVDMAVRLEQLAFRISANQMVGKTLRPAP